MATGADTPLNLPSIANWRKSFSCIGSNGYPFSWRSCLPISNSCPVIDSYCSPATLTAMTILLKEPIWKSEGISEPSAADYFRPKILFCQVFLNLTLWYKVILWQDTASGQSL